MVDDDNILPSESPTTIKTNDALKNRIHPFMGVFAAWRFLEVVTEFSGENYDFYLVIYHFHVDIVILGDVT